MAKLRALYYKARMKLQYWWAWNRYHIPHMLFKWNVDDEGDICFRLFFLINFIKYKEHTIIKLGWYDYNAAPKYVGVRA